MKKLTIANVVLLLLFLAIGVRIHLAPVQAEIYQGSCCPICYGDTIAANYRPKILAAAAQHLKLSPTKARKLAWFDKEIRATTLGRFLYLDPFIKYNDQIYALTVRAKRYWIMHYYEWKIISLKAAVLD